MKPNFALTLSFEGIGLLHRAFPGWHAVDEVALDSADLTSALADLREKAQRLDASGLRTKLVVPNDQIKYLQFDALGLEADEIGDAARRALDGVTPYAVDDLAYDWSISAGQVHVAAVARETLAEAEAFATEHGFNPLCFVAIPEGRDFVGEPWFGDTKASADILPEGGRVERDTAAIRIIGTAPVPEPSDTNKADTPVVDVPDATPVANDPADDGAVEAKDATEDNALPEDPEVKTALPSEDDTLSETTPPVTAEPDTPDEADPEDQKTEDAASDKDTATPDDAEPEADDAPDAPVPVSFSSIRARRDDVPPVAPRLSGATRKDSPASETPPDAVKPARQEPPLTTSAPETPDTPPPVTGTPQDALSEEAAARIGASLRPTEADRLAAEDDDVPEAPVRPSLKVDPTLTSAPMDPPDLPEQDPEPDPIADTQPEPVPATPRAPSFFTRRQAILKRGRPKDRGKPDPTASREQEKQRMTVFGAREPARVGGKPRFLGVILTAVLLIFLVGVAAWASIFLEDGLASILRDRDRGSETEQIAKTPEADIVPADAETNAPQSEETVVASLPNVTSDVDEPRATLPEPNPAELGPDEARARYAVTGIWQKAPDTPVAPEVLSLEDFYLTSIDPKVLEQDAIALPDASLLLNDARPDTPSDPPAADTTFLMDNRGLVRAAPEGALTPDGVRVFPGKPQRVPGARPTPPEPETTEAEDAPPDPELARLAAFRPKPRPTDLSEQNERSNLGGRTRNELAALRPKLRPQSAQERAEAAAQAAEAEAEAASETAAADITPDDAAVQAALAAAVQTPDPFAGATAQAVAISVKPKNRPRNFDRIVKRTQERSKQREQTQTASAVPRNQRITPSAPTATTVARAATEKNAIKLRRVNLIGVYGTPSNRRALVRLANGRYKKVKIGDRLDGGRVAAIGDGELRYVKSGRSVTLKMPRG